jgi:hypothetical protein
MLGDWRLGKITIPGMVINEHFDGEIRDWGLEINNLQSLITNLQK